jgi:hypothetical protein
MFSYSYLIFILCFGISLPSIGIATPLDAQIITRQARSATATDTQADIIRRLSTTPLLGKRSTYRTDNVDLDHSWEDVTLFSM